MSTWYLAVDGQAQGPYSDEEIAGMVRSGAIQMDALVWDAGSDDANLPWVKVSETPIVKKFSQTPITQPAPAPSPPYRHAQRMHTGPAHAMQERHTGKARFERSDIIKYASITLAIVVLCAASVVFVVHQKNKKEFNIYVDLLKSTSQEMISSGSKAESVANMTQNVWNNAIYEKWDSVTNPYTKVEHNNPYSTKYEDFNVALAKYAADPERIKQVAEVKVSQGIVQSNMRTLQSPPEGCRDAYDTITELFDVYNKLVALAVDPTGSLKSYTEAKDAATTGFTTLYRRLETRIPDRR